VAGPDPAQPFKLGQNWPDPKLIILVAACRMNSACSDNSTEQQGRAVDARQGWRTT